MYLWYLLCICRDLLLDSLASVDVRAGQGSGGALPVLRVMKVLVKCSTSADAIGTSDEGSTGSVVDKNVDKNAREQHLRTYAHQALRSVRAFSRNVRILMSDGSSGTDGTDDANIDNDTDSDSDGELTDKGLHEGGGCDTGDEIGDENRENSIPPTLALTKEVLNRVSYFLGASSSAERGMFW